MTETEAPPNPAPPEAPLEAPAQAVQAAEAARDRKAPSSPRLPASVARSIAIDRFDWEAPGAAACAALTEDLGRAKASLERHLAPAPRAFAGAMLARLAVAARMRPEDAADWEARSGEYLRLLGDFPADLWHTAADEWLLSSPWFPSIAELNAAMFPEFEKRQRALRRVEAMILAAGGPSRAALEAPAVAIWRSHQPDLREAIGDKAWRTWFGDAIPESDDGEILTLAVPTAFMAEYIGRTYGAVLGETIGRRVEVVQRIWAAQAAKARQAREWKERKLRSGGAAA